MSMTIVEMDLWSISSDSYTVLDVRKVLLLAFIMGLVYWCRDMSLTCGSEYLCATQIMEYGLHFGRIMVQ